MTQETSMKIRILGAAALFAAVAATGCATSPGYSSGGYNGGYAGSQANCYDCGTVTRIEQGSGSRVPNATGAVIGGVLGAAAAREVAKDRTDSDGRQNTATVAGAAAGAAIGNAIQNRAGTGYNIYVRMGDGRQVVVSQDDLGGIREGSYVEVRNGRAYAR
jgi:outer membrane lipoprotein SlyB